MIDEMENIGSWDWWMMYIIIKCYTIKLAAIKMIWGDKFQLYCFDDKVY